MKKNYLLCSLLAFGLMGTLHAQVGIGTMSPNAQLTINPGTTGLAPLELTPVITAPTTDLAAGQMAVINNELYFYEAGRSEWLSVSTMPMTYARGGSVSDENIYFGGRVLSQNAQSPMPLDGTIVHISAASSGGNATKRFQVRVRNGGSNVSVNEFNMVSNAYTETGTDIDFSAGDVIAVRARDDGNGDINNPTVVLWIKWRR